MKNLLKYVFIRTFNIIGIFGRLKRGEYMITKCSKCNSINLFVEIQANRRGLYCGECGRWQKWITKQELQVCKFNGIKIVERK